MIPLLEGRIPMIVEANDAGQIKGAVEWAEKEKIPLVGLRRPRRLAGRDLLAKKHVPVILLPVLSVPAREDEPYDTAYTVARSSTRRGWSSPSPAGGASNIRILPYQAGMAAAFGCRARRRCAA